MKTNSVSTRHSALLCALLLSVPIQAQESMTTAQLLENGHNDNAYATAMFVAGWAAGSAEQLRLRAQDLRAAGAASDRIDTLDRLVTCLTNDLEVADLWTGLRTAVQEGAIDLTMPAGSALNNVVIRMCTDQG